MPGKALGFNLLGEQALAEEIRNDSRIEVERIGGFAGFGLPGSRIKSRGVLSISKLSPADLSALDTLFSSDVPASQPMPDAFRYRITRVIGNKIQTIEIPEELVPMFIKNCVKDTLE